MKYQVLILLLSIFLYCGFVCSNKFSDKEKSILYNDTAVNIFIKVHAYGQMNKEDSAMLISAICFLDSSINYNPNNFVARYNKRMYLCFLGKYDEALQVINQTINAGDSNVALLIMKGALYEKINKKDSAISQYNDAERKLLKKIKRYPQDANIAGIYIYLLLVKDGKEVALKKFNEMTNRYKNDYFWLSQKEVILKYDKVKEPMYLR